MNKKTIIICVIIATILIAVAIGITSILYIQNNTVPTISLIGDENIKLKLNDTYEEQGVQAFLNKDNVSQNVIIDGNVNTSKVGKYSIKYTISNSKNKKPVTIQRNVYVEDNIPPTITLKGKAEVTISTGDTYKDDGCVAQDNYDGDITNKVEITGKVDTSKEGSYTIFYTVEDSSGNVAKISRTVTVIKKQVTVTANSKPIAGTEGKKNGLPVLMYHFFYDAKKGEKGADNNWMEVSAFEEQMKYLSENNYYFPSWEEVEAYIDGKKTLPAKSIVITIDDGDASFIKYAIPIIEKYNVKATSFVVTSWNGDWLPKSYISNHLDFQSHSHDMHRSGSNGKGRFVNLSYKEALEDVKKSKSIIGNCTVFCYPFGHYNDNAIKVLKDAGYKLAFTTQEGRVYKGANKYTLPRVRMSKGISLSAFKEAVK